MNRWHNHYVDNCAHVITSTVSEWRPVLLEGAEVVYRQWRDAAAIHECRILAYVLMPEHVHLVVWAARGDSVRAFTQRWLSMTARLLGTGGRFWKERPRVLPLWSPEVLKIKVDYIHRNPIRRDLVQHPEEWPRSSFRQIEMGQLDVPFLCDTFDSVELAGG